MGMDIATSIFMAFGLSMDAVAVSISSGITIKNLKLRNALLIGIFFGVFQGIMPIMGWIGSMGVSGYISRFDHWIAFGLLSLIGGKMIREALSEEEDKKELNPLNILVLLGLAIATSIDALAVGVSFACLKTSILTPVLLIGSITFILSFLGVIIGNKFGNLLGNKMELLGGFILIGIGIKILIEHLVI